MHRFLIHLGVFFNFIWGFINRHQLSIKRPEKMNKWVKNGLHKAEPMATQQGSTQGELYNNAKDKLSTLQIVQTLHMSDR